MAESMVNSALRSLYGQVGASQLIYDIESWNPATASAIISVEDGDDARKLWTGLAFMSWFNSNRLKAKVKVSEDDMALLFPSKPRKRR